MAATPSRFTVLPGYPKLKKSIGGDMRIEAAAQLCAIAFLQPHAKQLAAEIKELDRRLASRGLMG